MWCENRAKRCLRKHSIDCAERLQSRDFIVKRVSKSIKLNVLVMTCLTMRYRAGETRMCRHKNYFSLYELIRTITTSHPHSFSPFLKSSNNHYLPHLRRSVVDFLHSPRPGATSGTNQTWWPARAGGGVPLLWGWVRVLPPAALHPPTGALPTRTLFLVLFLLYL